MGTAFTGYAFTESRVWVLYDMLEGCYVDGRQWTNRATAESFVKQLSPALQERIEVIPRNIRELGQWEEGERIDY